MPVIHIPRQARQPYGESWELSTLATELSLTRFAWAGAHGVDAFGRPMVAVAPVVYRNAGATWATTSGGAHVELPGGIPATTPECSIFAVTGMESASASTDVSYGTASGRTSAGLMWAWATTHMLRARTPPTSYNLAPVVGSANHAETAIIGAYKRNALWSGYQNGSSIGSVAAPNLDQAHTQPLRVGHFGSTYLNVRCSAIALFASFVPEDIARELTRTPTAVYGMLLKLRPRRLYFLAAAAAPTLTAAIAHNLGSTTVTPRVTFTR